MALIEICTRLPDVQIHYFETGKPNVKLNSKNQQLRIMRLDRECAKQKSLAFSRGDHADGALSKVLNP